MPEMRVGVSVDVGPLEQLSSSARTVDSTLSSLVRRFSESGMSAKDCEGALIGLGYSAKQAAAAMTSLQGAVSGAASPMAAATTAVTSLDRAFATGGVRIAAYESGLGPLGFALSRIAGASATLAPILSAAFPVFALTAFVDLAGRAY